MTKILYTLIITLILLTYGQVLAVPKITNLIMPVSYFVNREKQLREIKDYLSQDRKVSIISTSGIGKTQLARVYAYKNNENYDITWFFDGNIGINEEFVKLAKQLNQMLNTNITEEIEYAFREVIDYLSHKKRWLLIFDNLKIGNNNRVKEIVDWQHKGHIIFCSQDSENLPNILEIFLLDRVNTTNLAKNLLVSANDKDIEFLIKAFNGYPILIVQGAQLLNKIKGLNKEEYKKKIYQSADKIAVNINSAIKELKPSAVSLLSKVALINNQGFSYEMLRAITPNEDTINEDIVQLSKFLLISCTDSGSENPIFEMHDIIADKIRKINGNKNKGYLEEIIVKLVSVIPNDIIKAHHFRNSKTIHNNFEIIVKNAEKYNISIYKLMELNLQLILQYLNAFDFYNGEKLVSWFNMNDKQGKFKLWLMSNNEKAIYARYLGAIGWYYMNMCERVVSLEYYTRDRDILNNITGYEAFKYHVFSGLANINTILGDFQKAEENIQIMEKMYSSQLVASVNRMFLYALKAPLFYLQGKYVEALEQVDQAIKILIDNGTDSKDSLFINRYLLRAEILNAIGRYQEAYKQVKHVYKMYQVTEQKVTHKILADIYHSTPHLLLKLKGMHNVFS
ncbi:tetratricopeptide repeat protein [Candidatus Tisiphia endosymbiont of Nemotelus uliginosus]|uniref:tetratricopeptide repeat protein n=1 Tax=Candidatus Tisiphia endosymbiont of Nemotelus uliginosus TaxID=3077926 RepID=UPI0035C8F001